MPITKLLSGLPDRLMVQEEFDPAMAQLMLDLPVWGGEVNSTAAAITSMAAGGAFALPYTFSSTTTDADPGTGILRLSSATQNTSTVIRLDLTGADTSTWTSVIDTFDDSTSTIKGHILLQKLGDTTKWLLFSVSALASPSGYKNITVANVASSTASPFTNGDSLILKFQRTGDKGDLTSNTEFTPVAVAALDINCALGNYFTKTITTGLNTFTFSNVPATGYSFTLELQHDGGTFAFPASVKSANDLLPAFTSGKTHLLMFVTKNGGTRFRLTVAENFTN